MSSARIGIVNYGMGNLRSVEKALERVGAEPTITGDPARLGATDGLVLPGVGAFPKAMERIRASGLANYLSDRAATGTPLLGICLGMQLLFESSTEHGGSEGLGLLDGHVDELDAAGLKLPHIGWSPLERVADSPLVAGMDEGEPFYFVHSYVARPSGDELIARAEHGERFAAVVGRERIFGAQFHPEKSGAAGLRLLANFTSICSPVVAGA